MNRILLTTAALTLIAGTAFAGPKDKPTAKGPDCAVMQHAIGTVDASTPKSVYQGKTYYFCCAACKPMFDKNPAKYVKAEAKPAKPAKNKKKA